MKQRILFAGLCLFFFSLADAQLTMSPELELALENKTSFKDVMETVTNYYIQKGYTKDPQMFREFKKWNRWAWYEMRHLDQDGNFVDGYKKINPALDITRQESEKDPDFNRTNGGYWTVVGPTNVGGGIGRVDKLAFHPTDPNQMFAGTPAGGLWKSTNGGNSWFPLNGYTPGLGVSGIIVDIDNPSNLYVLSGDGDSFINGGFIYTRSSVGLLRSTDGGGHWSIYSGIWTTTDPVFGFKLMQSKVLRYLFFACTTDGLFRSNDHGATWVRVASLGFNQVFDIEQADNGYIYVATSNRVYVSSDFGTNFTIVPLASFSTPPTAATQRTSISVPPNAQTTLYVHFGGNGLLYRSVNNGSSFTLMGPSAPTSTKYMAAMTVNPGNSNNVILGSLSLNTSTDGGATFPNTGANVHADFHDLEYNPLNNILYAGCDGGVYKSTDNGLNWVTAYDGMNTTQYYHMGCYPQNNGILMAGAQDNGMHECNTSNVFNLALGGDGFDAKFYNGNSDTAYFSMNAGVYKYSLGSNNAQLKLDPANNINDLNFFFPHLVIHSTNNNIVYAGYTNNIYKTINGGSTWTTIGNNASAGFAAAGGLDVSANLPDRLYAANASQAWRFDEQGASYVVISDKPGWPAGSPVITDIKTRPNSANEVIVTFGGYGAIRAVYSSNGGATWGNLTGSLPDVPIYCADFISDGDVYVGTDVGVYFKDYAWTDWVRFSNGLPVLPVTEIIVDEINQEVRAATFGRGIWLSDLYSSCGPFLFLSGNNFGTNFYQSNGFIESTQVSPGSYGNVLLLRSPTKITFKNGFRAEQFSKLRAVIGNCGQGILSSIGTDTPAELKEENTPIIEKEKND